MSSISRRRFIAGLGTVATAAMVGARVRDQGPTARAQGSQHHVYVARNGTPVTNVQQVIAMAGGIEQFCRNAGGNGNKSFSHQADVFDHKSGVLLEHDIAGQIDNNQDTAFMEVDFLHLALGDTRHSHRVSRRQSPHLGKHH